MANADWMPTTWAGKAAMFANVGAKIGNYDAELGLTPAEVAAAVAMCDQFAAQYSYVTQTQAYSQAVTQWRDLGMSGEPEGDPLGAPPVVPVYNSPGGEIIGLLDAFRAERDRWVAAAGYTQAIGEDLMIVSTAGAGFNPGDVTPTIAVSAAQADYLFGITVSNRADSDMWTVQTKQKGGSWQNAGSFTGKTADITVSPISDGDPEKVEVRVQLRKNNENYGNVSQTATVTVNP